MIKEIRLTGIQIEFCVYLTTALTAFSLHNTQVSTYNFENVWIANIKDIIKHHRVNFNFFKLYAKIIMPLYYLYVDATTKKIFKVW